MLSACKLVLKKVFMSCLFKLQLCAKGTFFCDCTSFTIHIWRWIKSICHRKHSFLFWQFVFWIAFGTTVRSHKKQTTVQNRPIPRLVLPVAVVVRTQEKHTIHCKWDDWLLEENEPRARFVVLLGWLHLQKRIMKKKHRKNRFRWDEHKTGCRVPALARHISTFFIETSSTAYICLKLVCMCRCRRGCTSPWVGRCNLKSNGEITSWFVCFVCSVTSDSHKQHDARHSEQHHLSINRGL